MARLTRTGATPNSGSTSNNSILGDLTLPVILKSPAGSIQPGFFFSPDYFFRVVFFRLSFRRVLDLNFTYLHSRLWPQLSHYLQRSFGPFLLINPLQFKYFSSCGHQRGYHPGLYMAMGDDIFINVFGGICGAVSTTIEG